MRSCRISKDFPMHGKNGNEFDCVPLLLPEGPRQCHASAQRCVLCKQSVADSSCCCHDKPACHKQGRNERRQRRFQAPAEVDSRIGGTAGHLNQRRPFLEKAHKVERSVDFRHTCSTCLNCIRPPSSSRTRIQALSFNFNTGNICEADSSSVSDFAM